MDDGTLKVIKDFAARVEGVVIVGQVAEVRVVPAGKDSRTGEPYASYTTARVVTGLGTSAQVKMPDGGGKPAEGQRIAFFCSRVWKGANGIAAQCDSFI